MRRFMCVWFPRWPIQRLLQVRPELGRRPIVLYVPAGRGGFQVLVCSRRAAKVGVKPAMPLAEAQVLAEGGRGQTFLSVASVQGNRGKQECLPGEHVHYALHDAHADLTGLRQLAWWCQQFSPFVGLEEAELPENLFLDISGCAHLFGGEQAMAERVVQEFRQRDLYARVAIAETIGAAWGVARYATRSVGEIALSPHPQPLSPKGRGENCAPREGRSTVVVPRGRIDDFIDPLCIQSLRLPAEIVEALYALDIRNVAQLRCLPRATLPSRFGPDLLWRLDQAFGQTPELLRLERPPEIIDAEWTSDFALRNRGHIETVLHELVTQIVGRVHARALGVQQLICSCHCEKHEPVQLSIRLLNASVSVRHLFELVRLQLERCVLPGEVQRIHVRVAGMGPIELHSLTLWDSEGKRCQERQVEQLVERLSSRLGEDAVLSSTLAPDAQPECLVRYQPTMSGKCRVMSGERKTGSERKAASPSTRESPPGLKRPMVVLPEPQAIDVMSIVPDGPPVRFQWREESYTIRWSWGPERIETGWWRGEHIRRDYYRVETGSGQWFWLFRRREDERWFLHGVFD